MAETSRRRWRDIIGTATAWACACLCLITLGFWVHSHWYADSVGYRRLDWTETPPQLRQSLLDVSAGSGSLELFIGQMESDVSSISDRRVAQKLANAGRTSSGAQWSASSARHPQGGSTRLFRFVYDPDAFVSVPPWTCWGKRVAFPIALPAVFFAAWPAIVLWRWRKRRQRLQVGLCRKCGYDLRATTVRCPECGTLLSDQSQPTSAARLAANPAVRLPIFSLLAYVCLYWSARGARTAIISYYAAAIGGISADHVETWLCLAFELCVGIVSLLLAVHAAVGMRRRAPTTKPLAPSFRAS